MAHAGQSRGQISWDAPESRQVLLRRLIAVSAVDSRRTFLLIPFFSPVIVLGNTVSSLPLAISGRTLGADQVDK